MYPFDSTRGRLALGLTAASGGGLLITFLMHLTKDPRHQQGLQLLLVFWLIFVGKTTLAYMRLLSKSQAAAAAQHQQQPADSSETIEERTTRRRRTRRD